MLKVMIVEDEDIVRDEIKHLIDWENHGFSLIAEARNGREGLQLFEERNPDIIISDIKMPGLGGLEMTSTILDRQKHKKVILLTAFGDFDFAREAIKLGIHSYVLKHELDGAVLVQELNKARQQIEEEESAEYLARKEHLRMFLKRVAAHPDDASPGLGRPFPWQGRTGMFILGFDRVQSQGQQGQAVPEGEGVERSEFIDFLYTRLFKGVDAEAADLNGREAAVFVRVPESFSEKKRYEFCWSFARHLQQRISEVYGCTVSIAIGPAFEHARDIGKSLRTTKQIYALRMFSKSSCILTDVRKIGVPDGEYGAADRLLAEIRDSLQAEEYDVAVKKIEELFTRRLVALQDPAFVRKCVFELVRIVNARRPPQQPVIDPIEKLAEIYELDNVFGISEWFADIVRQLAEESSSKYSRKIRDVLQYIHVNYQRDISLNEVADRLGLSLIYTSQLFKKEVGVSFVAYIARYRIERARELLETGKYKVHEVGAMVGYQTVQYFCKTYKRITGKNPGDR
ncbi:response regulator transcription factor [Paenibacillus humicola]|uniref:response regulator transcription factor n=1 Tax=Paenibacillus humicola TaxID=3110540 RepID=UPI00237BAD91|nr:response regulator [Paenibacillus humicola]